MTIQIFFISFQQLPANQKKTNKQTIKKKRLFTKGYHATSGTLVSLYRAVLCNWESTETAIQSSSSWRFSQ